MRQLALLVLAIAPTALPTAGDSVTELLQRFKNLDTHIEANDALRNRTPSEVIGPLVGAIRTDPDFSSSSFLRGAAYDVLTSVGETDANERLTYQDGQQVSQFLAGLDDPEASIRGICIRALGRVDPEFAKQASTSVEKFLIDPDPLVIGMTIGVISELGTASSEALLQLRDILVKGPNVPEDNWGRSAAELEELLMVIRTNAAFARVAISGVGTDLALYSQLDAPGREVAIDAITPAIAHDLMGREQKEALISSRDFEKVTEFLGGDAKNPTSKLKSRRKGITLLGWIGNSERVGSAAKAKAFQSLTELSQDPSTEISQAATDQLQAMSK